MRFLRGTIDRDDTVKTALIAVSILELQQTQRVLGSRPWEPPRRRMETLLYRRDGTRRDGTKGKTSGEGEVAAGIVSQDRRGNPMRV